MKVLPTSGRDLRIVLIALVLAAIYKATSFFTGVKSGSDFLLWLLDLLLWTVVIMVAIRLVVWIFKKVS